MSFSRIYAIFIRHYFLIKVNPIRMLNIFVWVVINILQWGFISKYLGSLGQTTFSFVTVILGAVILWEFMNRIQQGIMTAFLEDIWSQNFINYFASPLKMKEYLAGLVSISIMTTTFGFVAMASLAGLFFGFNILKIGFLIFPFLLILFIFGMSIGIFICSIVLRYGPTAEWLGWPIPWVLSIISGVFYPISALPIVLQYLAQLTPAAYVFESLRAILTIGSFSSSLWENLLIGLVLALIYLYLAYRFFISVYNRNLKTGGIARFSAES